MIRVERVEVFFFLLSECRGIIGDFGSREYVERCNCWQDAVRVLEMVSLDRQQK
jgi:hypothetical protein